MLIFSMIEVSLPEDQYNVNSQCSECSKAGGMSIPFSGILCLIFDTLLPVTKYDYASIQNSRLLTGGEHDN